jgi:tetraacyldisaccharide 4'-kinase
MTEVVYPAGAKGEWLAAASRFPALVLTRPGAAVYGLAARTVRGYRMQRRKPAPAGATVISIGNIELGGNGKTPFALWAVETLRRSGERPAYVSRGFGGRAERLDAVTAWLPNGLGGGATVPNGIRVVQAADGLASEIGDEGAMLASRCGDVPLLFSADRHRAVQEAVEWLGATHVVLDDAFQTWQLARDLDIVLVDAREPFGNGRLLPAGSLREEPAAIRRADIIGANGIQDAESLELVAERVRAGAGVSKPVFGIRRTVTFTGPDGTAASLPVSPVAALSSVARPGSFVRLLEGAGVHVAVSIRYPDHHPYLPADIATIEKHRSGTECVVTTEKDWAKLRDLDAPFEPVIARLELDVIPPDGADLPQILRKPQALPAAFVEP